MRKWWKETLLFLTIFGVYLSACQTDFSWAGYNCDVGDFWVAAKTGSIPHFPGFPLYAMLSYLTVRLPFATEGWNMAFFLSTIPAILTCILVFFAVRKQIQNKWAPYISCLALAGSAPFLMQASIAEIYTLSAFLAVACYTFLVYGKYRVAAIFAGLTCSMHWLAIFSIVVFFIWSKELRRKWRVYIPFAFLPYVYNLLMGTINPGMSMMSGDVWGWIQYIVGTLHENSGWWGSLPIIQIHEKLWTFVVILVGSFGLALIPLIRGIGEKPYVLICAAAIPLFYFLGCVLDLTIVHLLFAMPFLAILAGFGVDKMKIPPISVILVSLCLLISLPFTFGVGTAVDKNFSARHFYDQLHDIPDGSIVVGLSTWSVEEKELMLGFSGREQTILQIFKYENPEREIVPINIYRYSLFEKYRMGLGCMGESYREELSESYGIETPFAPAEDENDRETFWKNVLLLSESNPDRKVFYTTVPFEDPWLRVLKEYSHESFCDFAD